MLRWSLLVSCTGQQTDFMTYTRKTAFHYYKLQDLHWFMCFFHWRPLSHVVPQGVGRVFEGSAKERKAVRFLREIKAI